MIIPSPEVMAAVAALTDALVAWDEVRNETRITHEMRDRALARAAQATMRFDQADNKLKQAMQALVAVLRKEKNIDTREPYTNAGTD